VYDIEMDRWNGIVAVDQASSEETMSFLRHHPCRHLASAGSGSDANTTTAETAPAASMEVVEECMMYWRVMTEEKEVSPLARLTHPRTSTVLHELCSSAGAGAGAGTGAVLAGRDALCAMLLHAFIKELKRRPHTSLTLAKALDTIADHQGRSVLHVAACNGLVDTCNVLMSEGGADATARNRDGNTAVQVAADHGHTRLAHDLEMAVVAQLAAGSSGRGVVAAPISTALGPESAPPAPVFPLSADELREMTSKQEELARALMKQVCVLVDVMVKRWSLQRKEVVLC
jgi:hypothetical protein